MWWIIGGIILIAIMISSSSSTSKRKLAFETELPTGFADEIKPLLKEEFPEISDKFTTTTCMGLWSDMVKILTEHTKTKNFVEAVQKAGSMSARKKAEFEAKTEPLMKECIPKDIRAHIESIDGGMERFDKTIEVAGQKALADIMKRHS